MVVKKEKCNCTTSNNYEPYIKPPKEHCKPVECCGEYVESVFFEVDAFPMTNGQMIFENPREGMIIGFTWYFDSSQNDNVRCNIDMKTRNNQGSLLYYPTSNVNGANTQFRGTNTTQEVEFLLQMPISYKDQLILTWNNASASDCTIMAVANIRYRMGV